jgi:site-specific recombinase XerC
MRGIRRSNGAAKDQKSPLTAERLLNVLEQTPDTLQGLRDRALLLLGFAAALRLSTPE